MSEQESSTIPPFFNRIMKGMLRSPLHGVVSRSIMLITFTGRKSGKSYTTPISYALDQDVVTAFTHAKWARNLEGGAPVVVRIKNKDLQGRAEVVSDKAIIATNLQAFLTKVRSDAKYYQVQFDEDGTPNWEDIQRAAEQCDMLQIQLEGVTAVS